jgi:hypothetical protein
MSNEEIIQAVKEELIKTNKEFGIKKKLTDKDYMIIGVLVSALNNIKNKDHEETT